MTTIECVVLDLDDTLFLERDYVRSGFDHVGEVVAARFGVNAFGAECWRLFESGARGDVFDRAANAVAWRMPSGGVEFLVNEYRSHVPLIEIQPDRRAVIEQLSTRHRLAVMSGGSPIAQRAKFRALGIDALIDPVVFCGDWGPAFDKPDERGWLEVERLTGLSGVQLFYVADNPAKDWPASHARGWGFVRVRMPGSVYEDTPTPEDVPEVTDIVELTEVLGLNH